MIIQEYTIEKTLESKKHKVVYIGKRADTRYRLVEYLIPGLFERERRCLEKLNGDFLIPFVEEVVLGDRRILVYLYEEGVSPEYLGTEDVGLDKKIDFILSVTAALGKIHNQNYLYNNLSLDNCYISGDYKVRLFDFSQCTDSRDNFAGHHDIITTPLYVSPERTGKVDIGVEFESDYYSLGVMLYFILTGHYPFTADNDAELISLHVAGKVTPPASFNQEIDQRLSEIVLKLLEKNADDRYNSIDGISYDLKHYADKNFVIGTHDIDSRLVISDKIYGRSSEIKRLQKCVQRVRRGEVFLTTIAGYSGVGKSTVVSEFYREHKSGKSILISGKFQQYKKDIPYFALVEAFEEYFDILLLSSQENLDAFKQNFIQKIGDQGQILTSIFPKLELIIGKQKDVDRLLGEEAENRFKYVFIQMIELIATAEHPLILFLDDMQWTDLVTLNVLRVLFQNRIPYIMVVVSYRDNEVDTHHPFQYFLDEMAQSSVEINPIHVKDLTIENIRDLVKDTLKSDNHAFSDLIFQKTMGNSFFVHQFIKLVDDHGLFSHSSILKGWSVDLENIERLQVSNNVVEIMQNRLKKLPEKVLDLLKIAGASGNHVNIKVLSFLAGRSVEFITSALHLPLKDGLLYLKRDYLYFSHDRIQQACYQLNEEGDREHLHFSIANSLLEHGLYRTNEEIFAVSGHLIRGITYTYHNRTKYIDVFLSAALRSKGISAYKEFLYYLEFAMVLLDPSVSEKIHFRIYREYHIALYLNSRFDEADRFFEEKLVNHMDILSLKENYFSKVSQDSMRGKYRQAFEFGASVIRKVGININISPDYNDLVEEFNEVQILFREKGVSHITDLEGIKKKDSERMEFVSDLILAMVPAGFFHAPLTSPVLTLASLKLACEYGVFPSMGYPFSGAGPMFIMVKNDYRAGYEYAQYAMQIAAGNKRSFGNTKHIFVLFSWHWLRPMKDDRALDLARDAHQLLLQGGDIQMAGYTFYNTITYLWERGEVLEIVLAEIEKGMDFVERTHNNHGIGLYTSLKQLTMTLLSRDGDYIHLSQKGFSEEKFIRRFEKNRMALCLYYSYKTQILYIFGEFEAAYRTHLKARKLITHITGFITAQTCIFYGALAACRILSADDERWSGVKHDCEQMRKWAEGAPENFRHKLLLLEAEIAYVEKDYFAAGHFFSNAVRASKENNFIHESALACECFANYCSSLDNRELGEYYILQAYRHYETWGAVRKLEHIRNEYANLGFETGSGDLDLISVIHSQNVLARETRIDCLLQEMMKILLQVSGAEKGFLILKEKEWLIQAYKNIHGDESILEGTVLDEKLLSVDMVNYVIRTQRTANLENLSLYLNDEYIRKHDPKSIIVLPVSLQSQLIALIYLEHSSIGKIFTPRKEETIQLLSSQIAISLNNARVYNQLEELVAGRTQELEAQNEELARARQNAEMANDAKDRFFSIISHDLQGPIGSLDVIFNDVISSSADIDSYLLDVVRNTTRKTHQLLEELLTWSRQQQGRISIEPVSFNINDPVEDCIELLSGQAGQKNISIRKKNIQANPVYADRSMVQTVIRNFMNNAIKFTPEKGEIAVETLIRGEYLELSVHDNGVGIKEEYKERIFRIDKKIKSTPGTNQETGTGLGLILCYDFITKNNGDIGFESSPGEGSRFWFTIPLAAREEVSSFEEKGDLPDNLKRILLVEDNPLHLRSSSFILEKLGAAIDIAENGEEAYRAAQNSSYDIILMDLDMPVMNGIQASEKIRHSCSPLPRIIALTSYSFEEAEEKFGFTEFDGYLEKPLNTDSLLRLIHGFN